MRNTSIPCTMMAMTMNQHSCLSHLHYYCYSLHYCYDRCYCCCCCWTISFLFVLFLSIRRCFVVNSPMTMCRHYFHQRHPFPSHREMPLLNQPDGEKLINLHRLLYVKSVALKYKYFLDHLLKWVIRYVCVPVACSRLK